MPWKLKTKIIYYIQYLLSSQASDLCLSSWSIYFGSHGHSSRICHQNELTVRTWGKAVQELGKLSTSFLLLLIVTIKSTQVLSLFVSSLSQYRAVKHSKVPRLTWKGKQQVCVSSKLHRNLCFEFNPRPL